MVFFTSEDGWFGGGSDHGHEIALRANFVECQQTPVRQMVVHPDEIGPQPWSFSAAKSLHSFIRSIRLKKVSGRW